MVEVETFFEISIRVLLPIVSFREMSIASVPSRDPIARNEGEKIYREIKSCPIPRDDHRDNN